MPSISIFATGRAALACAAMLAPGIPIAAGSQLRPLSPIPWQVLAEPAALSAEIGISRLNDQRASLAGTSGNLWELGNVALAWRTGRVVVELAGTGQRLFHEHERFAEPLADVRSSDDDRRHDSGDYRISTVLRLTPDSWPGRAALRFGTRLPTTDNKTGLDRDAVDFFATVGGSLADRRFGASAEAGLGIHGTREPRFEQDDLFLYAVKAEYRALPITPSIELVGQKHGASHSAIRGVEDLGELRVGLRYGSRRWLRVEIVKGYETFSPSAGLIFTAGFIR